MAAYIVVEVNITDPSRYDEYKQLAAQTVADFGGRYIVRGGAIETLEGNWSPERFVVLEFPTVERAKQWWGSEEYRPAKELRQAIAKTEMILVAGT